MPQAANSTIRVLHVLGSMRRGGAETWLMHVFRALRASDVESHVMVHLTSPGEYDDEVRSLGVGLTVCPYTQRPARYARCLREVLRKHGPFDIVHSHVHHFSGFVLSVAAHAGVSVRIAHCHNDTRTEDSRSPVLRRAYLAAMKLLIRRYATVGCYVSERARASLFPIRSHEGTTRWRPLYCGIDLSPYGEVDSPGPIGNGLRLPVDGVVIGHVGSFTPQKNHRLLFRVFAAARRLEPRCHLLLVGEGPERRTYESLARQMGLHDAVTFAGTRSDVPHLMRSVINVLLLPSLYEGLPIVGLEAQAAGLPIVMSDAVTEELDVLPQLVFRHSLADPPEQWAKTALLAAAVTAPKEHLCAMQSSPFNIDNSVNSLVRLYRSQLQHE